MRLEPSQKSSPLSTVHQPPTSRSAPLWNTRLTAKRAPCLKSATRQLYRANVLAPSDRADRAKLLDYIEVILRCKGVFDLLIRCADMLLGSDHDVRGHCINHDRHPPFKRTAYHAFRS
jgi:hypothetical protein